MLGVYVLIIGVILIIASIGLAYIHSLHWLFIVSLVVGILFVIVGMIMAAFVGTADLVEEHPNIATALLI